jgi:hypothetical protein
LITKVIGNRGRSRRISRCARDLPNATKRANAMFAWFEVIGDSKSFFSFTP